MGTMDNFREMATTAYHTRQVEDAECRKQKAREFFEHATRKLKERFRIDLGQCAVTNSEPRAVRFNTPDGVEMEVRYEYDAVALYVCVNCFNCQEPHWLGECTCLADIGRRLEEGVGRCRRCDAPPYESRTWQDKLAEALEEALGSMAVIAEF